MQDDEPARFATPSFKLVFAVLAVLVILLLLKLQWAV
jgi:hypothetical protein